ncbi:MAG: hypothetical protein LUQ20_00090 [Candidatus Methanoperedens sp.]|nr:hypothetical protein [Candidatus Methanoperedens sp.]
MPTISSTKLSKEKLRQLKSNTFEEWYGAAAQATVDTLGLEDIMKITQQYDKLSGHAIVINLEAKNRFPYSYSDLLRVAIQFFYIMPLSWSAKISNGFLTANSFFAEVTQCKFQDAPIEFCEGCNTLGQAEAETINPAFIFNTDMGLKKGLGRCKLIVKKKGGNVESIEEATVCILPVKVTEEEIDFWSIHATTIYWGYFSTLLVDSVGEEKAKEIFGPYMEKAGVSVALKLKKELKIEETDARGIGAIIDFLNDISSQNGWLAQFSQDVAAKTIDQCPFSTGSSIMCYQYEKICNGICKAINPEYSFKYEKMMTKGDSYCSWVIEK